MIQIGIVDDDKVLSDKLASALSQQNDFECTLQASSLGALFESIDPVSQPDILLLDIQLGVISSIDHLEKIKALLPQSKIIIMTGYSDKRYIVDALQRGANSYILKGQAPTKIFEAIRETHNKGSFLGPQAASVVVEHLRNHIPGKGQPTFSTTDLPWDLTVREAQVAQDLTEGFSYKEISQQRNISINTVRHHIKSLYRKTEVSNKMQLLQKLKSALGH